MTDRIHYASAGATRKPEHTSTPWAVENGMAGNVEIVCIANPNLRVAFMAHDGTARNYSGLDNAALIVRAVNAHEEMLAVARETLVALENLIHEARAAIALAEGERG